MSYRVKKNDTVIVRTGKDKKKTGKVIFVNPDGEFIKVENLNMVSRHRKARSAQESGGISKMEGNIHISNVQVVCPDCGQPTRIGAAFADGKKIRVCKKCGAGLEVKAEKPKKAKKEKTERTAEKTAKTDSRVKRTRKTKTDAEATQPKEE